MNVSKKSVYNQLLRAIIAKTNQELGKYKPGDFVELYYYNDGNEYAFYRIKGIEYGEISDSLLWGAKVTHIPSLTAENLETGGLCDLIQFYEGGSVVREHGYRLPKMSPFFEAVNHGKDQIRIDTLGGRSLRKMDNAEVVRLIKRIKVQQDAKREEEQAKKRAAEQRKRENASITAEEIESLYREISNPNQ